MIDSLNAVAVGEYGVAIRTQLAGSQWSVTFPPEAGPSLRTVAVFDGAYGVALGDSGLLMNTTDGGWNWVARSRSGILDPRAAVMFDRWNGLASSSSGSNGYTTSDGGYSWWPRPFFWNGTYLALGVSAASTIVAAGEMGRYVRTTDGGRSWDVHSTGDTCQLYAVASPASAAFTLVGERGRILRSDDNGVSWRRRREYLRLN